jgi:hypothetical protein
MMTQYAPLERDFRAAYAQLNGCLVREFRQLEAELYRINGIVFTRAEVENTLKSMYKELQASHEASRQTLKQMFCRSVGA